MGTKIQDLHDGESLLVRGSGVKPYELKNIGGVYSCSCPAWRNQSLPIERRSCKHLRKLRGDEAEIKRTGEANFAVLQKTAASEAKAPRLLLANNWDDSQKVNGWWLSEKLDGVRAYWDGERLISRLGNQFHAPDWFTCSLPTVPLDGELWIGRKKFQQTVSVVRRQDRGEQWRAIRFMVFDLPLSRAPFEERLTELKTIIAGLGPGPVELHNQIRCQGLSHLRAELDRIEALGGEGLMLRQPESQYELGRSQTLLKVKRFHDAEAVLVGYEAGKGKHKGRIGSLRLQLANGVEFSVGTGLSDAERKNPPHTGSIITFRYQEFSDGGVPRFPSYLRVRQAAIAARGRTINANKETKKAQSSSKSRSRAAGDSARRFVFEGSGSSKFWETELHGCELVIRFGRIGTTGQEKVKTFADAAAATNEQAKLIKQKTGKGYQEL